MNRAMNGLLIAGVAAILAGCEWSGGGDGWNSRWNFVNFSGSYSGSPLVSAYSMTAGGGGTTDTGESYVNWTESSTRDIYLQTVFSGTVSHPEVLPKSLSIVGSGALTGFAVHDDGSGGLEGESFVVAGTTIKVSGWIVYGTGQWAVNLSPAFPIDASTAITITYSQIVPAGTGGGGSSGTPGSTKVTILSFNVQQTGNTLKIIDNNGSVYEGSFGDVSTTGGGASGGTFANGDEIIGQYSANGKSAAGINVNMVGTFQATVSGASAGTGGSQTMTLSNRRILGTWIEDGGATGNINGGSASVSVTTTVSSNSTSTATTQ